MLNRAEEEVTSHLVTRVATDGAEDGNEILKYFN